MKRNSIFALPLLGTASRSVEERVTSPEDEVILLFNQLRDPLLRYTISLGVSATDGEDLIQEVFLSLFRHLCLGKSRTNLRGWVFRVAHNMALKHRGAGLRFKFFPATLAEVGPDRDENPEEQLASGQRQRLLLGILDALPETDRNCLRLRAEGLRYREIAEALHISLASVSKSITRSFAKLNRADGR